MHVRYLPFLGTAILTTVSVTTAQTAATSPVQPAGAKPTSPQPSESILAPSRIAGVAYALLEPQVILSDGASIGAAAAFGYVGTAPYRLELLVSPLMTAPFQEKYQVIGVFSAIAMYDEYLFGIGPLLGYATTHDLSVPLFGAAVRLGAHDGLSLNLRASAALVAQPRAVPVGAPVPSPHRELELGELALRLLAPIARRTALFCDLTALRLNIARAGAGLRARMTETRGSGGMWLELHVGYGLFDAGRIPGDDSTDYRAGPLFGIGFERRF